MCLTPAYCAVAFGPRTRRGPPRRTVGPDPEGPGSRMSKAGLGTARNTYGDQSAIRCGSRTPQLFAKKDNHVSQFVSRRTSCVNSEFCSA